MLAIPHFGATAFCMVSTNRFACPIEWNTHIERLKAYKGPLVHFAAGQIFEGEHRHGNWYCEMV